MKKYAELFYKSKTWQHTREAYAKSKGGLCEACLVKGVVTPGEIVHHKKPITPGNIQDPEITLSWDNLQLLCRECHAKAHERKSSKRRYYFDAEGHCLPKETQPEA